MLQHAWRRATAATYAGLRTRAAPPLGGVGSKRGAPRRSPWAAPASLRALSAAADNEAAFQAAAAAAPEEPKVEASSWWTQDPSDVVSASNAVSALEFQDPDPSTLGYGPMDLATYAIDYFHFTTGMPWWMSIVAVAGVLRLSVLPLTIFQMRTTMRMTHLQPEMQLLQARMQEKGDITPEQQAAFANEMSLIQKRHGVKIWAMFVPVFAQLPIFLTMFWTLRDMAVNYPSFAHGGTLWFTNLAEADPTYGLPILTAASFLAMSEMTSASESPNKENAQRMKVVMRFVGLSMVPITIMQPSAIAVYWTASNVFTLAQSLFFRIPGAKDAMGIKLLPEIEARVKSAAAADAQTPLGPPKLFSANPRRARWSRRKNE